MKPAESANDLTAQLLIDIPRTWPGSRVWRNNTGKAVGWDTAQRAAWHIMGGQQAAAVALLKRPISFGLVGSSDILGIMPPNGRLIAIEVKWGRDRIKVEQQAFADMVIGNGGIYVLARTLEQGLLDLRRQL